jgi:hypothetical protein
MADFICPPNSGESGIKYEFDWLKVLIDWMAINRRKDKMFSFSAIPWKYLWNEYFKFLDTRCNTLFLTAFNGQTLSLERMLNILFDDVDRGIVIKNKTTIFLSMHLFNRNETAATGEDPFLFNRSEVLPMAATQRYLFNLEEIDTQFDFTVCIPSVVYGSINLGQVESVIRTYTPIGKTFNIEQI